MPFRHHELAGERAIAVVVQHEPLLRLRALLLFSQLISLHLVCQLSRQDREHPTSLLARPQLPSAGQTSCPHPSPSRPMTLPPTQPARPGSLPGLGRRHERSLSPASAATGHQPRPHACDDRSAATASRATFTQQSLPGSHLSASPATHPSRSLRRHRPSHARRLPRLVATVETSPATPTPSTPLGPAPNPGHPHSPVPHAEQPAALPARPAPLPPAAETRAEEQVPCMSIYERLFDVERCGVAREICGQLRRSRTAVERSREAPAFGPVSNS